MRSNDIDNKWNQLVNIIKKAGHSVFSKHNDKDCSHVVMLDRRIALLKERGKLRREFENIGKLLPCTVEFMNLQMFATCCLLCCFLGKLLFA